MVVTKCSEVEAELKFTKLEASQQAKLWSDTIESLERKLGERQTEVWRLNLVIDGLERKQVAQTIELERLHRTADLGSLVVDLPYCCVEDLASGDRMREVKRSAL